MFGSSTMLLNLFHSAAATAEAAEMFRGAAGQRASIKELVNVTANYYVHSFETAATAMRLVKEGKRSFFTQYLLNPSAEFYDLYFVAAMFFFICLVRFVLAGAHHPRTRHSPSLFKLLFGKVSKPKRESKMCENLWYDRVIIHPPRILYINTH